MVSLTLALFQNEDDNGQHPGFVPYSGTGFTAQYRDCTVAGQIAYHHDLTLFARDMTDRTKSMSIQVQPVFLNGQYSETKGSFTLPWPQVASQGDPSNVEFGGPIRGMVRTTRLIPSTSSF